MTAARQVALRLDRVALNVADLGAATRFYCEALGFSVARADAADPQLARVLGVRTARSARLRRGGQVLELSACDPRGAPVPADSRSDDAWFQHCALVTDDIAADYDMLRRFAWAPISRHGPQALPSGIAAFKFRDPDGHPLELIAFPQPDPATAGGIDHSAICVADPARSIAFYAARLGLEVKSRQVNSGPAQDALDGLDDAVVDVVALATATPGVHVELLGYRHPRGRPDAAHPSDIAASRMVFAMAQPAAEADPAAQQTGTGVALLHDPDGHASLLECPP